MKPKINQLNSNASSGLVCNTTLRSLGRRDRVGLLPDWTTRETNDLGFVPVAAPSVPARSNVLVYESALSTVAKEIRAARCQPPPSLRLIFLAWFDQITRSRGSDIHIPSSDPSLCPTLQTVGHCSTIPVHPHYPLPCRWPHRALGQLNPRGPPSPQPHGPTQRVLIPTVALELGSPSYLTRSLMAWQKFLSLGFHFYSVTGCSCPVSGGFGALWSTGKIHRCLLGWKTVLGTGLLDKIGTVVETHISSAKTWFFYQTQRKLM